VLEVLIGQWHQPDAAGSQRRLRRGAHRGHFRSLATARRVRQLVSPRPISRGPPITIISRTQIDQTRSPTAGRRLRIPTRSEGGQPPEYGYSPG
jgi:hypothetical protein